MQRREFIKTVGASPLAAGIAKAALATTEQAFRKDGLRQVLVLSGPWQLRMDPKNQGMTRNWFSTDPPNAEARAIAIDVPSVWQQYVVADGGIAWYTNTFSLPKEFLSRSLRLRFGAVDYRARVWLNGQELGSHEGGFTPFDLDMGRAAREEKNRLVVRVSDAARTFNKNYAGLPGWDRPSWDLTDGIDFDLIPPGFQNWREGFNHSGIWQPVEVIVHDHVYVADAFILPNLSSAAIEARLEVVNQTKMGFTLGIHGDNDPWGAYSGPYGWAAGNTRAGSPVTRHAVFDGLPGPGLMDWQYGNIMTARIPLPFWASAEQTGPAMPIIPLDSGKVACCAFELLDNLEHDGLAERLLSNLVGYLHRQLPAQLRQRTAREEGTLRFHQQQIQDCWDKFPLA